MHAKSITAKLTVHNVECKASAPLEVNALSNKDNSVNMRSNNPTVLHENIMSLHDALLTSGLNEREVVNSETSTTGRRLNINKVKQAYAQTYTNVKSPMLSKDMVGELNIIKERVAQQQSIPVGGRLKLFWREWRKAGAPKSTVRWLRKGYPLPFRRPMGQQPEVKLLMRSPKGLLTNYRLGSEKQLALECKINELLAKGAIQEMPESQPGFFSRVFLRAKRTGGYRLILDVSELNEHLVCQTFKMDTTQVICDAIKIDLWATSVDFSDAYHHIPMRPAHYKYLCFEIGGRRFWFISLPFGLSPAPRVFTTVLRTVKDWARRLLMLIFQYLDDWLNLACSFQKAWQMTMKFVHKCLDLGLMINLNKSELIPVQKILFLGRVFDFTVGRVFVSPEAIKSINSKICTISEFNRPPLWRAESLLGSMSSAEKAVRTGRLNLRAFQACVNKSVRLGRTSYRRVIMTSQAWADLTWWSVRANLTAGQLFVTPPPTIQVQSDASTSGWGITVKGKVFKGQWSVRERKLHINLLELRVILIACQVCPQLLKNRVVQFLLDNSTAVAHLNHQGGTRSRLMMEETRRVFQGLLTLNVTPLASHIAGELNVIADLASRQRQVINTEWRLSEDAFRWIVDESLWGQPEVDLFANQLNHQLKLYFSPCPDELAMGVDALNSQWPAQHVLYAFPPAVILERVAKKLQHTKSAKVLLVAPFLPNATWFPTIRRLTVQSPRPIPVAHDLLEQPHWNYHHPDPALMRLHLWMVKTPG